MLTVETLYAVDPEAAKGFDTKGLRKNFHVGGQFAKGEIRLTYTHYDRMIVGGAVPAGGELVLDRVAECGTSSFLNRREVGILNIGETGTIQAGNDSWTLENGDMLYLPMGSGAVTFAGHGRFYIASAPAHHAYPAALIRPEDANQVHLGSPETANHRTICQCIHPDGVESCQLVMGYTQLHNGSVWNTMPTHVHDRRMEAYLYYNVAKEQRVFHFMGHPQETRHLVMANEDIVLSPPWSIHSGVGTGSYTFCWAMAGDNMQFTDMDMVAMEDIR
ncbi:5-dehydro-4-deoxy-D-glucuronate isomerase [Pelagimonas varians]|uniref:4-deoxy-L-threo-5-hexosulose-uronate ketol-isomerase n=1 Tax=Pelagimonas varians TaxID=696760 RepID=A0A238KMV6_9RHOB|nr:5-dehydro-4-deoxy-D-glucuronate isomerase [Pelagimonas varians]PYG28926.1 4-deoxy-L-threo-5-hexosulose-uronate ketol-isomerase [Pelagimonas varians]SMX44095.1 4-deoxy-L-threo-5-hexosulose-uronate ketol-isomerase [Pelagimonas varians]